MSKSARKTRIRPTRATDWRNAQLTAKGRAALEVDVYTPEFYSRLDSLSLSGQMLVVSAVCLASMEHSSIHGPIGDGRALHTARQWRCHRRRKGGVR